ncbi:MAG: YraN family protein [Holosporales bacterium]|jgi:putative endonuclease|nr:YraN family protein [Holosporales bacterium]
MQCFSDVEKSQKILSIKRSSIEAVSVNKNEKGLSLINKNTFANKNSYQQGIHSEQKAVSFLRKHGHTILKQRYRTECGEIDIITMKDSVLHVIEVKSRESISKARYSISPKQKLRISSSIEVFLQQNSVPFRGIQIDAVLVAWNELVLVENAWYLDELQEIA